MATISSDRGEVDPAQSEQEQTHTNIFRSIAMTLQSSHPTVFRQILSKLELSSDEFEDAVAVSAVDLENNALGDDQSQSTVYTNPNALEDADAGNYLNRNQGRDTFLKARIGEGIDDQLATMKKDAVCDCKAVVSAAKEANTMTAYINNLLNYPDEIGVLWRTVRILKDKTLNSNELATSNKEEIATLNGIELITSSMSSFPNHEGLNMLGIKTLGNLAFNNNDNRGERATTLLTTFTTKLTMSCSKNRPEERSGRCFGCHVRFHQKGRFVWVRVRYSN